MKIPCEIIDDLLPLYEDAVCNQTTKTAVQSHLAECPRCRSRLTGTTLTEPAPIPEDTDRESAAAKKSFQKIRWVWISSLAVVLAVALLLGAGVHLFVQAKLPDDYEESFALGKQFIQHLCNEEFYEAVTLVQLPYQSEQWLEYHRQEFVDAMTACLDQGICFASYDGFDGYDPTNTSTGNMNPQFFEGASRYVHYYLFRVTLQTSEGETLPATFCIAFRNGEMFHIRLDCAITPETQMLKEALAHTELTN